MIAAFLCGLMYGALAYRRWLTAHNRRVLKATLPPSDDEFDMEAWDDLSDEVLANFEGKLDGDFGILSDYVPDSGLRVCWPQEEWKRHLARPLPGTIVDGVRRLSVAEERKPVEGLRHTSSGDLVPDCGDSTATAEDPAHYGKGWGPDPYSGYQPTRYPSSGTQM